MKNIVLIMYFDKKTEELAGKEYLSDMTPDEMRKILMLEYDKDDPNVVYDYQFFEKSAVFLKVYTKLSFDFDRYDYFLGRCSIE